MSDIATPAAPAATPQPDEAKLDAAKAYQTSQSKPAPGQEKAETKDKGEKEKGPAPWHKDLEELTQDEEHRSKFDSYMREKVQPRMTQLETDLKGYNDLYNGNMEAASAGAKILAGLYENAPDTLKQIARELNIDLKTLIDIAEDASEEVDGEDDEEQDDPRLKWVEEQKAKQESEAAQKEYEELLEEIGSNVPGFDPDVFTDCFIVAKGDLESAFNRYMDKYHKEPEKEPEAPATLGSNTGGTAPREEQKYNSIDEAMQSFLSEEKARRGQK